MSETHTATSNQDGLSSLPGLGIVRIRGLRKAGWTSVEALRAASLEDLMAIPNFSERIAANLYAYLHGAEPEEPAPAEPDAAEQSLSIPETEGESLPEPEAARASELSVALTSLSQRSAELLASQAALRFEPALARQLARLQSLPGQ